MFAIQTNHSQAELRLKIFSHRDTDKIPAILAAASVSHGYTQPRSTDWFRWKYLASPFGPAVIAYAEAIDDTIAGVVAFGRYLLTSGESDIEAALSYETFVHPRFRRQGLFTQLLDLAVAECKALGIKVLFNFPNGQSIRGFLKQGWTQEQCIQSFLRVANWYRFSRKLGPSVFTSSFIPTRVDKINENDYANLSEHSRLVQSFRSDYHWAAVRTPEYLQWRYWTFPRNRYVVVDDNDGWAIIRLGKRGGLSEAQIMELFPSSSYSIRFLNRICRRVSTTLSPDIISLTLSKAHPAAKAVLMSQFIPVPNHVNFTSLLLDAHQCVRQREWVLTATDFHTY